MQEEAKSIQIDKENLIEDKGLAVEQAKADQ